MTGLTAVSLFAGIGGIDLALERAGIKVVAAVEIDKDCQAKLREHFPGVTILSDVTEVTGDQLLAAGFVPRRGLMAAGWPCQGNSVAGGRGGMGDPRSGLWRHVVRLLAETRPRWFLGENVPGLLSVSRGRDIAVVRGDLAQLGYWWAERILDAQHFGVPQRRRRVFFVGCAGDRARPVQVLLEPESRDGDPAPGGEAWPGTAAASDGRTVGTIQGGGRRGHRVDAESAAGGQLVAMGFAENQRGEVVTSVVSHQLTTGGGKPGQGYPAVIHAITAREGKGPDSDAVSGFVTVPLAVRGRDGGAQLEAGQPGDPMFTLRAGDGGSSRSPMIAHALTAEGADASEDGTGRGTPLVVAAPLTSGSHGNGVSAPGRRQEDDGQPGAVAFTDQYDDVARTEAAGLPGWYVAPAVRRLTPLECERLQGFPDHWTAGQSDSTRYRQLGNAVAVPCVEWITRRIAEIDEAAA